MGTDRHRPYRRPAGAAPHPLDTLAATPPGAPRDVDALIEILNRIDAEGWQSPIATALVGYVRDTIVRPLVVDLGLRGAASSEAETSAWEEVWLVLRSDAVRRAGSPWGLIWSTARRAILTEALCALYPTAPRRAWKLADRGRAPIRALPDLDSTEFPNAGLDGRPDRPVPGVSATIEVLVLTGWPRDKAEEIVVDILSEEPDTRSTRWMSHPHGWAASGWRAMAHRLELPDWQARRLMIVLRGTPHRPGLLPRLIRDGVAEPHLGRGWWLALAATRDRTMRAPVVPDEPPSVATQVDRAGERRAS